MPSRKNKSRKARARPEEAKRQPRATKDAHQLVRSFIKHLRDTSTRVTEESKDKGFTKTTVRLNAEVVKAARSALTDSEGNSRIFTITGRDQLTPTADGSGNYAGNIAVDPSTAAGGGVQDWTSFAALFDIFRVVRISIVGMTRHPAVAAGMGYFSLAYDVNSSPAPALATMLDYDNYKLCPSDRQFRYEAAMPSLKGQLIANQPWYPTSTPAQQLGSIMVFGANFPVSVTAGQILCTYEIEFAMRS